MRKLGVLISIPTEVAKKYKQYENKELLEHILYDDTFAANVLDFIEIKVNDIEDEVTIFDNKDDIMKFTDVFINGVDKQSRIQEFISRSFARDCRIIYYN